MCQTSQHQWETAAYYSASTFHPKSSDLVYSKTSVQSVAQISPEMLWMQQTPSPQAYYF